jgi:UDP:flavonoid glycosyltransferase YjiC (YdhE family)
MNIVIQVVGSRGDVQPFVALGLELKRSFGYRVRIATHAVFKNFVEQHDLEFFSIGGNPEELMAFVSISCLEFFIATFRSVEYPSFRTSNNP